MEWGDPTGGHGVMRACCGVRALLGVARRAGRLHRRYARLRAALADLAARALCALAALHLHARSVHADAPLPLYSLRWVPRVMVKDELSLLFFGKK